MEYAVLSISLSVICFLFGLRAGRNYMKHKTVFWFRFIIDKDNEEVDKLVDFYLRCMDD